MYLEDKTILANVKKSVKESFIAPLLIIIFAIVLYRNPENFISVAVSIFVYGSIFIGVLDLVFYFRLNESEKLLSKHMNQGILLIAFGIIAFFENALLSEMITVLLGGYILFQNASRIGLALYLKNKTKNAWIYVLVMALINLIIGLFVIINPFQNVQLNLYLASLLVIAEVFLIIQNILILIGIRSHDKEDK